MVPLTQPVTHDLSCGGPLQLLSLGQNFIALSLCIPLRGENPASFSVHLGPEGREGQRSYSSILTGSPPKKETAGSISSICIYLPCL